jgi:hypothetical protein
MLKPESPSPPHQIDPESLVALPRASGVCIFKGEDRLPSYSGKRADIRSGVLAHLSAIHEVDMIAQSRRVELV